jgi:diaminopimelate epimerase
VVIPVADVQAVDLERLGAALEVDAAFPARTNVHFVQVLAPDHLVMRVWERGAGPTLACGTGACATLVACHRLGLCDNRAQLDLPGGALWIEWQGEGQPVVMTGPAEAVFDGVLVPALLGLGLEESGPAAGASEAIGAAPEVAPEWSTASTSAAPSAAESAIDCATVCGNGCVRPEDCPSAEARARVAALLEGRSLDELVALASATAADRAQRPPGRDDQT